MPRRGDCRDEKRIFSRQQAAYMLYAAVWRVFGASLQVGTKVRGHTPNPEQPANQPTSQPGWIIAGRGIFGPLCTHSIVYPFVCVGGQKALLLELKGRLGKQS